MAKTTEKYEVLYVLNPNLTEEETQAIVGKVQDSDRAERHRR